MIINIFIDFFKEVKFNLPARNVKEDIGGPEFNENNIRRNLFDLVHANAFRMQEAARVLEEIYDDNFFKKIRFFNIFQFSTTRRISDFKAETLRVVPQIINQFFLVSFNEEYRTKKSKF